MDCLMNATNWPRFPRIIERDYVSYIHKDLEGNDILLQQHKNGLFVVCIPIEHPIRKLGKKITAVDFNAGKHTLEKYKVAGKKKKSAVFLQKEEILCKITAEVLIGEECRLVEYLIPACVNGRVIEVNDKRIHGNANLILERGEDLGWLAILSTKKEQKHLVRCDEPSDDLLARALVGGGYQPNDGESITAISGAVHEMPCADEAD